VILREFIGAMKNTFGWPELLSFWISFLSFFFWLLEFDPLFGGEVIGMSSKFWER
jgi:hypothetical protein